MKKYFVFLLANSSGFLIGVGLSRLMHINTNSELNLWIITIMCLIFGTILIRLISHAYYEIKDKDER